MRLSSISRSAPTSVESRSRGSSRRGGYCFSAKTPALLRTRQMRLLRPPPKTRLNSTALPTRARATSVACARPSSIARKNPILNVTPACANDIRSRGVRLFVLGEQNTLHVGRESRIEQNLLEVIDEVRTGERGDPGKLLRPAAFKKYVQCGDTELSLHQAVRRHPLARRVAQVDTLRVVMSVFGLVTDNRHRAPFRPATAEKTIDAGDKRRA